jgi:hypothetical protein
MYKSQLAHSASTYNSNVIKQQGLDERRARTLIEASDSFIKNNAGSPAYMNNPQLLQQDAMAYARRMQQEFMPNAPGGTVPAQAAPAGNRPPLNQLLPIK